MSIQFLDMRMSQDSTMDTPPVSLARNGYVFGNIGLQTAGLAPGNAALVRVTLSAYVRLTVYPSVIVSNDITFGIYRNNSLIFSTVYPGDITELNNIYKLVNITAVDYPPAADVLAGQIQYTAVVSAIRNADLGARSFSGIAVAG
ncbi:hypothetical protein [Paenibacillus tengchongensis]|uniref:hypothetical protein n=1 Tax=Paenibacillus tengchongensis TaxID=2608684 RepID=UPI00124D8630|nr:hypothetical protein [Paenibacillus tengchongensis]